MMPAMENRADENMAQRAEGPVEIGVDHAGGDDVERTDHQENVGRDAAQQRDDVDKAGAQRQVDGMKARRAGPFQILGGVMHSMVFPQKAAMEAAVNPVQHE